LCGFETWPLREKHRLRVLENRVLWKIFRPETDEVTGKWRRIHSEDLHEQYNSPNDIGLKNSRKIKYAGNVTRKGERRSAYR